jgi:molybdopterin synthase catalytic subunit
MGSAAQLPMFAWQADQCQVWRLLVNHKEYMVDRLNDQIELLRQEKERMRLEFEHQEGERTIGEIILCIIMFAAGWALAVALA